MAPKSVTFRRHDHLVSVLFGDLLSHSYNITFSMFLDLVQYSVVVHFFWAIAVMDLELAKGMIQVGKNVCESLSPDRF